VRLSTLTNVAHALAVSLTRTIFDCYYRLDLATLPWIAA